MATTSRFRQKQAVIALLKNVNGMDVAFDYPVGLNSPLIVGQTYACISIFQTRETPLGGTKAAPYQSQERDLVIHIVRWSDPLDRNAAADASRQALVEGFDTLLDSVEQAIRLSSGLSDGGGKVFLKFGLEFDTEQWEPDLQQDRTIQQAWIIVKGMTWQT